ncbi:biotin synthase [Methylibium rhizosphaerae]|uniref:biotin synthase n=1 Tax=Methylibium rhizosphaerae TaxID=2570323 RepID=UPI00112B2C9A|nr:biotin synthase [Methylibium rhizosphaerae]
MNAAARAPSASRPDAAAVAAVLRRAARAKAAPWLHGEVARRMADKLDFIKLTPQRVVEWWGFSGGGPALAERYPQAERVIVEPTAALQQRSREAARLPWWSPRRWQVGAPQVLLDSVEPPPQAAQLLWSNMMLHWADDAPATVARWFDCLAVDGFVMFSCFGPDTLKELRALYRRLGWPAPGHEFTDMHNIGDLLVEAGFADPVMDMEQLTLTYASPAALLEELRGLGGNASGTRGHGLCTPRWRRRLEQELQSMAGADGRLSMSFEIVYGHALKPVPRVRMAEQSSVSLEQMRQMVRKPRDR